MYSLAPVDADLQNRLRQPSAVRYIKLGQGGTWAAEAIDQSIIPFGFRQVAHEPCADGDWDKVRQMLATGGRTKSGISQGVRELQDFYELPDDALWITFADRHLYWAFAFAAVVAFRDPAPGGWHRFRPCIGGWSRLSLNGEPLSTTSLSSALTRVAGFRQTICTVEREEYLLRRIRGEEEPLLTKAREVRSELEGVALEMIAGLDWRDFETMVDLLFANGGWRRQSALAAGEVDIDLLLDNPVTGEAAWVQVKSTAGQAVFDDYLDRFRRDGSAQHFFFVCHSPAAKLRAPAAPGIHIWAGPQLARAALSAGLFDWLIERTR
ncbi:MAG TPA: restriction endonuclease [Sphingomicrobium sp.]|nr:restriction endonuclease [Sphingomicrobium sp.]